MAWRGSTTLQDRILGALPYLLPMVEAMGLGLILTTQFPPLATVLLPLLPFTIAYGILDGVLRGYGGFVIFMALFMLVVRNESIRHFIRFNTMQAIIIGICMSLATLLLQGLGISNGLLAVPVPFMALIGIIFLGVMGSSLYSMVMALLGKYPEMPVVSEAAYAQVR